MGGNGGGGGGYEAEYTAYEHSPSGYQGQNEINEAARGQNNYADWNINANVIPRMNSIQYYQMINRLHMEATDTINDQTNFFTEVYPNKVIERIINIEEAYQRILDYLAFFNTFDKASFKSNLDKHLQWFQTTNTEICAMVQKANRIKQRELLKNSIEAALIAGRRNYVDQCQDTSAPPYEFKIPIADKNSFEESYLTFSNDDATDPNRIRLYMSLPPPQTGTF